MDWRIILKWILKKSIEGSWTKLYICMYVCMHACIMYLLIHIRKGQKPSSSGQNACFVCESPSEISNFGLEDNIKMDLKEIDRGILD